MSREERNKWAGREFESLSRGLKNKKYLDFHSFLRIKNFKAQAPTMESSKRVEDLTERAFALARRNRAKEAILALLELDGVGIPTASTIQKMRFSIFFCPTSNIG